MSVCEGNITEQVCVEISDVPAGGLACDLEVTLNFTEVSACELILHADSHMFETRMGLAKP